MSSQKKAPNARGGKKGGGRRRFTPKPRPDQNSERRKTGATFTIVDDEPRRIVNPLCDIPRIEGLLQHHHDPPNALELYVWSDLVFGKPDTFPLSYYARLLGFHVDPTPEDKYVALDPATIPRIKDIPHIPPLGSIVKSWRQDDDLLEYKDPLYSALLEESSQGVENLNKAAINHGANRILSSPCMELAKELLGAHLQEFKTDDRGGEFGVVCGEYSIRYDFMWYQVSKEDTKSRRETAKAVNPHGLTSLASRVQKPKVSELTLLVKCIGKGRHLAPSPPENSNGVLTTSNSESTKLSSFQPSESRLLTSGTSSTRILNPVTAFETSVANEKKENNEGEEDFESEPGQTVTGSEFESTDEPVLIILAALCLEHARACDIFYGFVQVANPSIATLLCKYFRMVPLKNDDESRATTLLCDLNKCSYKYAFLLYKTPPQQQSEALQDDGNIDLRILARLPTIEMVKRTIDGVEPKPQKSRSKRVESGCIKSATNALRSLGFGLRMEGETIKPLVNGVCLTTEALETNNFEQIPTWNILRTFSTHANIAGEEGRSEILDSLIKKRDEVVSIESRMELKLRSILTAVLDERIRHEKAVTKRLEDEETLKDYNDILNRRRELDLAFQKQRDQDMDAVCEICNDGEVTPDNQILFCEACNVAIHQFCYGIERVPEGDYYCIACRYFGREKANMAIARQIERGAVLKMGPSPLPINCELCPRKQGAFIRTDTSTHVTNADGINVSKWIHVLCAKWQGLNFIDNEKKDCVEDVLTLKHTFRLHGIICKLCQGDRGAFNQCRVPGCETWVHVTCARSYGRCEVVHGENCYGEVLDNPWTLSCPDHSNVVPPHDSSTLEQLVMWAKTFPPEPPVEKILPKPCNRPFGKLSGRERREFLSVLENEKALVDDLMTKKLHGVRCEVCHTLEDEGKNLTKCVCCGVVFCDSCKLPFDDDDVEAKQFKCQACKFVEEAKSKQEAVEKPKCVLCFQPGGWLRMARGTPMKKWACNRQKEFEKTLFGKTLWVHSLCAMWQHPLLVTDMTSKEVNLSDAIMTHGKGFILGMNRCELCGQKDGLKLKCSNPSCRQRGHRSKPSHTHVTCARQAGFEVDTSTVGDDITFHVNCYRHVSCEFAFRARLEDLIEFEKLRTGKKMDDSKSMSTNHASRLLNSAIVVMNYLGWAWRWAEWWVEYGSNWEPLIEPGQNEKKMTKEQLKIVDSTPESRCEDARRCRLAAFGSALRNRSYDEEENGPTVMLERALRAVLSTPSLVGPLTKMEIDFFVQWLGIAYRSKSRLLGFGDDKIVVDENAPSCRHEEDKSPKFVLGDRRLPGQQTLPDDQVFETDFVDRDDFLNPERLEDGMLYSEFLETKKALKQKQTKQPAQHTASPERGRGAGRPKRKYSDLDPSDEVLVGSEPAKKRGRPPKRTPTEEPATNFVEFTGKTSVLEQGNAQIPKRPRHPTNKWGHSWDESAVESVLAVEKLLMKKGKKSSVLVESNNSENPGRTRRTSALGKVTGETISACAMTNEANGDVSMHVAGTDPKSLDEARAGNEVASPKRRRGRPPKIRKLDSNNGDALVRDRKHSLKARRTTPVSYKEEDWDEDFEEECETDKTPEPTKKKEYVIPRKAKRMLSPKEGGLVEELNDAEDTRPLSSLRDSLRTKQDRDDEDDTPEPEPDLSSPQKRGRYRGKLEAAKVILPGTERSVL